MATDETGTSALSDGSETFALDLLESMVTSLPPDTLVTLLNSQALHKADLYRRQLGEGSLEERIRTLVQLRSDEGYVSEMVPAAEGSGWCTSTSTTAPSAHCEEHPAVCDQELQVIRMTFQGLQSGADSLATGIRALLWFSDQPQVNPLHQPSSDLHP